MSKTEELKRLYLKYGLTKDDVFKHKHYTIITRSGIDKIQAKEGISVLYEVIESQPHYWAVKAMATYHDELKEIYIETFGSALYGEYGKGNCTTFYVAEMAEKRAMFTSIVNSAFCRA